MLRSLGTNLAIFWTWWTRELRDLVPWKSPSVVPGHKAYREIFLFGDDLEVIDISNDTSGEIRVSTGYLRQSSIVGDEAPAALLLKRGKPLILTLPVEKCFLHSLEVPKAALSRIDQFLDLELSRVTPFAATDVLTGWYETAENSTDSHTTVSQIIAMRSIVAPLLDALARWGVPVYGIFAKSTDGKYLPARLTNSTIVIGDHALARWRKLAVASCAFAAFCGLVGVWNLFSLQAAKLEDLSQRTEIAQKKALDVRKRLSVMESSSQRIIQLKTAKLTGPSPLAIWEELTRLIPDTAWISALAIDKTQVTLEGNARSPEELITLLDASPLFEAVSFNAPVTKLPGNDLTRFVIRLSLSKSLQVSSAAP